MIESGLLKGFEESEKRYGLAKVARGKVSPFDVRSKKALQKGYMRGGDRIGIHSYGGVYARELADFVDKKVVIVEVGVLAGNGLAMWKDAFPKARVIGLDIDLKAFYRNEENLVERGAFRQGRPEVYEFDQLENVEKERELVANILKGDEIDVLIDDGLHTEVAIRNTVRIMKGFMGKCGKYFVEDNGSIEEAVREELGFGWKVDGFKTGGKASDFLVVGHRDGI